MLDFATLEQRGPLLFPCSSLRRDTLPSVLAQAGLRLEELVCYCTEPHPAIEESVGSFLGGLSPGSDATIAVFFSPSGVNYALEKLIVMTKNHRISLKVITN